MRKLILTLMALLFVAALAPALGTPLFSGVTPVYAHPGHTGCAGGAARVVALGGLPAGPGNGPSGADTAALATSEPNALSDDVAFLHLFPGFLCNVD